MTRNSPLSPHPCLSALLPPHRDNLLIPSKSGVCFGRPFTEGGEKKKKGEQQQQQKKRTVRAREARSR